jgi:hypothetical protein
MLTKADLDQFIGTTHYYPHWLQRFVLTEGVNYIGEHGGAWIVDAIASHQTPKLLFDPTLRDFQVWELEVSADCSAVLNCLRDTDDVVLQQEIGYTDFPLSIKFYLTQGVLMLPSEY